MKISHETHRVMSFVFVAAITISQALTAAQAASVFPGNRLGNMVDNCTSGVKIVPPQRDGSGGMSANEVVCKKIHCFYDRSHNQTICYTEKRRPPKLNSAGIPETGGRNNTTQTANPSNNTSGGIVSHPIGDGGPIVK